MEFLKCRRLPWQVKRRIVSLFLGNRCQLCDEGVGVLCRIDNAYELRSLSCVTDMLDDDSPKVLEDGIVRQKWSFVACSVGSSVNNLSSA